MNIQKAIEHFEWKFKNVWKPTPKDVEAFNALIEYKELQETINMSENENLAKLWIHQLMLLNQTEMYSAERAIQVIDEILDKSVYDWCKEMHTQANIMRFNTLLDKKQYKTSLKQNKLVKMREIGSDIILENEDEFKKTLIDEIKLENVIKFVKNQINRIVNKYEK